MTITCSTKVCSFGKQVVEKVEVSISYNDTLIEQSVGILCDKFSSFSVQTEYPRDEGGGRYVYRITRSPMCEYMISFIHRLKHLPEKYMMNSVLENFTILQVTISVCIHSHVQLHIEHQLSKCVPDSIGVYN